MLATALRSATIVFRVARLIDGSRSGEICLASWTSKGSRAVVHPAKETI
eukprot:SAG31_NODE_46186_length_255_cov_1.000000_1_plen_48_part_01